jgi:multidrug transporter EmrE-like cation transporter
MGFYDYIYLFIAIAYAIIGILHLREEGDMNWRKTTYVVVYLIIAILYFMLWRQHDEKIDEKH